MKSAKKDYFKKHMITKRVGGTMEQLLRLLMKAAKVSDLKKCEKIKF